VLVSAADPCRLRSGRPLNAVDRRMETQKLDRALTFVQEAPARNAQRPSGSGRELSAEEP